MLVVAVASSALLGLIFYLIIQRYHVRHFVSKSAAALVVLYFSFAIAIWLSLVAASLAGVYLVLTRPEYLRNHHVAALWIFVVLLVGGTIFALPFPDVVDLSSKLVKKD
jgi:hypothetical protein